MIKTILIFSTSYLPQIGGAELAIKNVTDRLPKHNFILICAKLRASALSVERLGNVEVRRIGLGRPLDRYLLPVLGALVAWRIRPKPQVVWSVMANYAGFAALFYSWLAPDARYLLTLQEGLPMEYFVKRTRMLGGLYRAIYRRAAKLTAISRYLANWSKRLGFRGDPEIVPNGVDLATFNRQSDPVERGRWRATLGFNDADCVVVTTSRLSAKNGVGDLIEAMRLLPDNFKLLIIGEGELSQTLKAKAAPFGRRVTFLGEKPPVELPAWLQASDVFCRPSLSEGLGNSFLEAMAAGLPIVGTPVGGIPDFLKEGETGLMCAVADPPSIAAAIRRVCGDRVLRERVIRQGRALVLKDYNWDDIARRFGRLFGELMS